MAIYYLLSGGDIKNGMFSKENIEILKKDLKGKKRLVSIGSKRNVLDNDIYFYGDKNNYGTIKTFEFSDIEKFDLIDERTSKERGLELLKKADIIYLQGGNQFIQMQYIRNNDFDSFLRDYDGIILGLSAGSMNMGNISFYSGERDLYYNGLGLVSLNIDPHFDISSKKRIQNILKNSYLFPIIGLPDGSLIRVSNGEKLNCGIHYLYEDGECKIINNVTEIND